MQPNPMVDVSKLNSGFQGSSTTIKAGGAYHKGYKKAFKMKKNPKLEITKNFQ